MKPTESDIIAINQVLALLSHLIDKRELDRLGEVLTPDALYDCNIFGFGTATGLDAIRSLLNRDGHALAHHCTNVFVHEAPGEAVGALSKGLGLLVGGGAASITYADRLVRTPSGWRIASHVLAFNRQQEQK